MAELRQRADGQWVEVTPPGCPNGHAWDRPGSCRPLWQDARGWACTAPDCGGEVWEEPPRPFGGYPAPVNSG